MSQTNIRSQPTLFSGQLKTGKRTRVITNAKNCLTDSVVYTYTISLFRFRKKGRYSHTFTELFPLAPEKESVGQYGLTEAYQDSSFSLN